MRSDIAARVVLHTIARYSGDDAEGRRGGNDAYSPFSPCCIFDGGRKKIFQGVTLSKGPR